jgi:membrane metallo-endopeptidase-like protein 1
LGNVTLFDRDIVYVKELEYLCNVSSIIDQYSPRTIQNYMIWRFMMNQVDLMSERFRSIKEKFDRVFQGINKQPSRAIKCGIYVNDNMGFALSKLYIEMYFDKNALNQVK